MIRRALLVLSAVVFALAAMAAVPRARRSPAIVFMSDFGTANDAAAICRAVMAGIAPEARLMDITHQVTPFNIEEAARNLESVTPWYPAGTVFVVVVDPGVGTAREALIVRSKRDQWFVLPDNGLVWPVIVRDGLAGARRIAAPAWMIGGRLSSTFHGRDVFSPAAAHLAQGWDWTKAGPTVDSLVRLAPRLARVTADGIDGELIGLDDPYGNVITNITEQEFTRLGYRTGDRVSVTLEGREHVLPFVRTFADVAEGQPLLYVDSRGRMALALNMGDLSRAWGLRPPGRVHVARPAPR
ncbi:MAG: SAM-dependent chlorinase/fluorinase [Candidatus Eisenbacteria bacterium]